MQQLCTPESAFENWMEILSELCIPTLISPIHDRDITNTGEKKKAHYHVMLLYESLKSESQVREVVDLIGGVGVIPISCPRAYMQYLTHKNNPEKAQYDEDDIIALSGASCEVVGDMAQKKYITISEMIDYCEENDIYSFAQLFTYSKNNRMDWFITLCDTATLPIVQYLKSRYWEINNMRKD